VRTIWTFRSVLGIYTNAFLAVCSPFEGWQ
jgi:hypothetical protein